MFRSDFFLPLSHIPPCYHANPPPPPPPPRFPTSDWAPCDWYNGLKMSLPLVDKRQNNNWISVELLIALVPEHNACV